ncbi:MAG TPA: amidohydrolase [Terriglobales bacterium]|nr:amidohydrolase [Terriglobales bacterium]
MRLSCFPLVFFLLAVCFSIPLVAADPLPPPVDLIVTNARIYTMNPQHKWAEAIAIRGEKIVAAGDRKSIEAMRGPATKVIDADQHMVLPGFTDCHIHFMDGSLGLTRVDLNDSKTIEEIQKRVKAYADAHPNEPWIQGMGWTYPTFGGSALPNKKILDEVVPDRPVYLVAFDGHSSWANSKALAMAGIDRNTADPPNGKIVRDEKGEATGALKEAAGDLVAAKVPKPTRAERLEALRKGIHEANKAGLVRVHSAGQDFEYLDLYNELRKNGELTLRFYVAYFLDPPGLTPESIALIESARRQYNDDWISGGVVKTMLDGVVEAHTAAMLEPYSDDPTLSGKLFWDPGKYKETIADLDARGFQIFTHAIGDQAVRLALDAYQNAATVNHTKDRRPRIEHIETISAQDIDRFGKLGVIASMQPLHSYPDEDTLEIWARNIGPERAKRAWVWHSIEDTGGALAFGSDWPVVTLNPWRGVQTALTRQTDEGKPEYGFVPQQRLSLDDTLRAYTIGAAFAGHREKTEGSIETGKLADLIVLDRNLYKIEPTEIGKTEVLMTMVGGKVVYESPNWKSPAVTEKK